jgi:ABC-type Fe3+ transport system substrate-binding protein
MKKAKCKPLFSITAAILAAGMVLTGCGGSSSGSSASSSADTQAKEQSSADSASSDADSVVIYCNSDDEALEVIKKTLDANGFEGKYTISTFGTSELGGKMLAEGENLEADLLCMSSFYTDSAQEQYNMFQDLNVESQPLQDWPTYYRPMLANQGALFYNTEELEAEGLDVPTSIKDLAKDEYAGKISVPDITGSSTAWLMIQALIDAYGEDEAKDILTAIYKNAGDNLEDAGSGPIKKVLAGEAVIGFGLRHQAVKDKADGEPIDYVDPSEGDFSLTEGVAVIDHGDDAKTQLAQDIASCIIDKGRTDMLSYYPVALYEGEEPDSEYVAPNAKTFSEPLTVDLLQKHTDLSESCK